MKITKVGGWPVVCASRKEFAKQMALDCQQLKNEESKSSPKLAFSLNGEALSLAETNSYFRNSLLKADYLQADGQSLVFASKFSKQESLPERIATTDFFHDAANVAIEKGLSFYLLGASQNEIESAVTFCNELYPDLKIAGYRNGYFKESEEEDICSDIIRSHADVLWVGLGKPKEQVFCIRNLEHLTGVCWVKTCGGLFNFLSGKNSRAPNWMQKYGLEWLYRMSIEPRRLFKRYLITNLHAVWIYIRANNSVD